MYAEVAINVPLRTFFTYSVPDDLVNRVRSGVRVVVPFGKKRLVGICWQVTEKTEQKKIRPLESVIDQEPLFSKADNDWLNFAIEYYQASPGQVLSQALPGSYLDLKKIEKDKEPKARLPKISKDFAGKDVNLTEEQQACVNQITSHLSEFFPALIHGVTGSGKTEVYINIIKEVLNAGKSALFLVPEIGLTPQMLARLNHHFEGRLLIYHSGLTPNQRHLQWQACLENKAQVLVGTRSALFSPFKNLGLVIVDEEHDHSYKQEDRFRYHGRDLAVMRAKFNACPVVLGSATPSLESYHNAKEGRYHLFKLASRIGKAELPDVRLIDFAKERDQTLSALQISQALHDAIESARKKKQKIMMFVGQRGFAQSAFCVDCKSVALCPNCSVGLKYHKKNNHLLCHYCEYEMRFNEVCPYCKKKAQTLLGFGTQSIEEELTTNHPGIRLMRLDSDVINTATQMHEAMASFARGEIDLLLGTQMIAKGHDFPGVSFVGMMGLDAQLGFPDFRAAERSFQTMVQMAGRAGRSDQKGLVLVQTYLPEDRYLAFAKEQDYEGFAEHELQHRQMLNYPPFARLVQIRFLSNHEKLLLDFFANWRSFLEQLRRRLQKDGVQILGPVEMPLSKIRGKFRYHVLFKFPRGLKVQSVLKYVLDDLEKRDLKGVQVQCDVDPMSLL